MIVAGIGARASATADEIVRAVVECCERNGIDPSEVGKLACLDRPATVAILRAAVDQLTATSGDDGKTDGDDNRTMDDNSRTMDDRISVRQGMEILSFSVVDLQLQADRCATQSEKSMAATGVPSVAEAAALAAAGPEGMLLAPRVAFTTVTVALAIGPGATSP